MGEGGVSFEEVTIGPCRLIRADCLEVLPTLGIVDAVVTDPPYGIKWDGINHGCLNGNRGMYNGHREIVSRVKDEAVIESDDVPFDPNPFLDLGVCCFTGAQHFYDRLPPGGSIHCWNKKGHYKPMDHGDGDIIWCSRRGCSRIFDLVWRGLCRHSENTERYQHPTQKPVALMAWMIELCGNPGAVLDPYMGSGSTGVACARDARRFVGIEIRKDYFDIACRRIEEAWGRGSLFDDTRKPEPELFSEGAA